MELGMIGLGRMGGNMAARLAAGGHRVVGFDPSAEARARASTHTATVESLPELTGKLSAPRIVWLMVPAGNPVDDAIAALKTHLAAGDTLVDGGNSFYRDTQRRARALAERGIDFVDVGTSGGIRGRETGYCMMVGGAQRAVERLHPVIHTLAPAADKGWAHLGPSGAGHFVKMIHNGIEYGLMQAYAEGFALMQRKSEFSFDLQAVAETWREGSVIRSWLLDLTASALRDNPGLENIAPYVPDSGEGRWTVAEAIALDVPAPVITLALLERLRSRERNSYADRLLAALRHAFGGHAVRTHA